ncbi:hypothetical protein H0H92_013830, partial [Tricholoma furcatifolium]
MHPQPPLHRTQPHTVYLTTTQTTAPRRNAHPNATNGSDAYAQPGLDPQQVSAMDLESSMAQAAARHAPEQAAA